MERCMGRLQQMLVILLMVLLIAEMLVRTDYSAYVILFQSSGVACPESKHTSGTSNIPNYGSASKGEWTPSIDIPLLTEDLPDRDKMPKVGVCAIVKDSFRYLEEWVDYNIHALGFHMMYLYDNDEDHEKMSKWYQRRYRYEEENNLTHHVHVRHWPHVSDKGKQHETHEQGAAYTDCTERFGDQVDYMAYFDDDEFLVLFKHSNVGDFVKDHLINGSSLTVNWRVFGTSDHFEYAPQPVTKRFVHRLKKTHENLKSFVRPQDYDGFISAHAVKLKKEQRPGQEKPTWRDTTGGTGHYSNIGHANFDGPDDVAVFHHYKFKSEAEWKWKTCDRLRLTYSFNSKEECGKPIHPGLNEFDDVAWQILKYRVPKYAVFDQLHDFL